MFRQTVARDLRIFHLAALASLALGCAVDPRTSLNTAAHRELKARNYAAAEKYAGAAVKEATLNNQEFSLAIGLFQLGEIYLAQQRYGEAEKNLRYSLEIFERVEKPPPFGRYWTTANLQRLGLLYETQGRYIQAEESYRRALARTEKAYGGRHGEIVQPLNALSRVCSAQRRFNDAEKFSRRALSIADQSGGEPGDLGAALSYLGLSYLGQGKNADAEKELARALRAFEEKSETDNVDYALALVYFARANLAQRKFSAADIYFRRGLVALGKSNGPDDPAVASTLRELASLYVEQNRDIEAELLYKRVLALQAKVLGPTHFEVGTTLEAYAALLRKNEREAEAAELTKRAKRIRDTTSKEKS